MKTALSKTGGCRCIRLFMQMSGVLCKFKCKSKVPVFLFLDDVLFYRSKLKYVKICNPRNWAVTQWLSTHNIRSDW